MTRTRLDLLMEVIGWTAVVGVLLFAVAWVVSR